MRDLAEASCAGHPLAQPGLADSVPWRSCDVCGHVFAAGWFAPEVASALFSRANLEQTASGLSDAEFELQRKACSRIVHRVASVRREIGGRWLEVGLGAGALLATADEFGFDVTGLDVREAAVAGARELGLEALRADFERFTPRERFDVLSMADVLEHLPFPRKALARAHELLAPGGTLFVSCPNMDSAAWRRLDQRRVNPYWSELEHYHNFGRDRLFALLLTCGFEPCDYAVSERYRAGMEVIARRIDQPRA